MISNREYQIIKLVKEKKLKSFELIKQKIEGELVNDFEIANLTKNGIFEKRSTTCHTLDITSKGQRFLEEYEAELESSKLKLEEIDIAKKANEIDEKGNTIAEEGNEIAKKALHKSTVSNWIAIASAIIAVLSLAASIVAIILNS